MFCKNRPREMVAVVRSTMMPPPRPVAALPVTSASVSASVACSLVTPEKSPWTNSPAPTCAVFPRTTVRVSATDAAERTDPAEFTDPAQRPPPKPPS